MLKLSIKYEGKFAIIQGKKNFMLLSNKNII